MWMLAIALRSRRIWSLSSRKTQRHQCTQTPAASCGILNAVSIGWAKVLWKLQAGLPRRLVRSILYFWFKAILVSMIKLRRAWNCKLLREASVQYYNISNPWYVLGCPDITWSFSTTRSAVLSCPWRRVSGSQGHKQLRHWKQFRRICDGCVNLTSLSMCTELCGGLFTGEFR